MANGTFKNPWAEIRKLGRAERLALVSKDDTSKTLAHPITDYKFLCLIVFANGNYSVTTIPTATIDWGHTDNYTAELHVPRATGLISKDNLYSDLAVYFGVQITSSTTVNISCAYCNSNFIDNLEIVGVG